jgi:hypothetical protein
MFRWANRQAKVFCSENPGDKGTEGSNSSGCLFVLRSFPREIIHMKRVLGLFSLLVSSFVLIGPAWTAPGSRLNVITVQSLVERVQSCRAGTYWCPGQVSGCCPNGYGCGSTSCIRPGSPRVSAPTVRVPSASVRTNVPRISPPTVRTTTPRVRTPTITGSTPRVPRTDTGACPSLKGLAADMGGLLGC